MMLCGVILWRKRWARDMPQLLRRAIRDREFYLVYQPIVDIRTKQWIGAEALLRWKRPYGAEPMGPDIFIPAVRALRPVRGDRGAGVRSGGRGPAGHRIACAGFYVSLNISANEVKSGSGRALTERLLRETGLPPSWINIELTERGLLEENARETIDGIRALGVKVAIDDFGTGYSSLAYLGRFRWIT
ncbi:EAL domain-containing protein [Achromobacter xylosoxidans]